ncbi:MAG: hypothetical protein ACREYE_09155 [Gammaproteobacteria bacterium]
MITPTTTFLSKRTSFSLCDGPDDLGTFDPRGVGNHRCRLGHPHRDHRAHEPVPAAALYHLDLLRLRLSDLFDEAKRTRWIRIQREKDAEARLATALETALGSWTYGESWWSVRTCAHH